MPDEETRPPLYRVDVSRWTDDKKTTFHTNQTGFAQEKPANETFDAARNDPLVARVALWRLTNWRVEIVCLHINPSDHVIASSPWPEPKPSDALEVLRGRAEDPDSLVRDTAEIAIREIEKLRGITSGGE